MDPSTTIERAQIIQGNSLQLSKGISYESGTHQLTLFPSSHKAYTMKGEMHEVELGLMDVILMNPPFTKIERGIRNYVDMTRFGNVCGNEIGLWGHFLKLANIF